MALADFTPERVQVNYKGKALVSVRGLSLEDISILVRAHLDDLQRLFKLASEAGDDLFSRLNQDGFLVRLVTQAPLLASTTLALAADEPGGAEAAARLPMPLQVKTLGEIMRLTFEDVGGPKAFVALIAKMIGQPQLP